MRGLVRSPARTLWAVLAIGALTRLVMLVVALTHLDQASVNDSPLYLTFGRHLARSLSDNPELTLSRTPGYPAFLAVVLPLGGIRTVLVVQFLLGVATVWLVYETARRLASPAVAAVAALVVAVDPMSVIHGSLVLTETLFTFLLTLAVLLWVVAEQESRRLLYVASALLFGVGAIVRPILLYFAVVLVVFAAARIRRVALVVAVAVACLALPGAWLVRNHGPAGGYVYSSVQSYNLYAYRAAYAIASDEHIGVDQARQDLDRQYPPVPGESIAHRSTVEKNAAIEQMKQHPVGVAKTTAKGVGLMLVGPGSQIISEAPGHPSSLVQRPIAAFSGLLALVCAAFAAVGIVGMVRARRVGHHLLPLVTLTYLFVISIGAEAEARFRVPLLPLLVLFAAPPAVSLLRRLTKRAPEDAPAEPEAERARPGDAAA